MNWQQHLPSRRRLAQLSQALLITLLLAGLWPAASQAAPDACPASPSGLPDRIERPTFCVYYDDNDTTDAQATTVADTTQAYWDRYTTGLGFRQPLFSSKLVVEILDSSSCNGGTSPSSNDFNVFNSCFVTNEMIRGVTGHELFHRVQYSYHGNEVKWFKEGTARAMEDLAFTDVDHRPDALTAAFSFNGQANEYLGNTNVDITSIPQRYNSALWWKYFAEQFGVTATEPERGVDAMRALWDSAVALDDIAALNDALANLNAGANFDAAFRRFTAANWIKDLTNQPSAAFNYIDEDEAGSPGQYGPVFPTNGGAVSICAPAPLSHQTDHRDGARYFRATPSNSNCPVVSATFHKDAGPAFYHIITQKGNALASYDQGSATDFTRSFFNDGLTSIVAIAGSTDNSAQVDITLQCVNPVIDIKLPRGAAKANVGPFDAPGKFLAQVLVTNGDPKGPVVAGLTIDDFKARVNGQNALITGGGFIQQQYWLVIQAPNQSSDGIYDLEIVLEQSGTTTPLATDTNVTSVAYNSNNSDQVLVIDRSGSMSADGKMEAAKQAARFYVDVTRNNDGLAVVPYNENVNPAPFGIRAVTAAPDVRQQAKDYIDTLTAGGATSIGDGMAEGVAQRNASPTTNPLCSFVLLSDGMENSAQFWSDVQTDVLDTGCPVTAIAFGAASDETLMQNIATATGGLYFYNDVFVGNVAAAGADSVDALAETALSLGNNYEYTQAKNDGRQRLMQDEGQISFAVGGSRVQTHTVQIDDTVRAALFALDWVPGLGL
ncbi:MAG TPA: VWA domain-containing protein, partial [Caldilineaceae bacterium]|nr:VWA domain-containing protein [Caldilineaceae bacterium]